MSTFPTEIRALAVGVVLALQPARDQVASMEIRRAPDNGSGAPDTGNAVTVAVLEPGAHVYTDIIGGVGPYHYGARHVRPGATASSWTGWVAARPTLITGELPNIPQTAEVTGCEITFDANGNVVASVAGDLDTVNLYINVGNGSAPADPTPSTNHGSVSGRSGTITTTQKITTGNDAYVKVVGANVFGSLGEVRTFRQARRIGPFHKDTSTRSHTGNTTETELERITIPAGRLGANGGFHFRMRFGQQTTSPTTLRVKLNTTSVSSPNIGTVTAAGWLEIQVFNDGATNAQQADGFMLRSGVNPLVLFGTAAVDSTAAVDIVVTIQLGNAADVFDLLMTHAELIGTD